MVNYLYDLDDIEKNHEAYAEGRTRRRIERGEDAWCAGPATDLVPAAG